MQVGFFKPKGQEPSIAYTAGHHVGIDGVDSNGTRTYNLEAVENGGLWHLCIEDWFGGGGEELREEKRERLRLRVKGEGERRGEKKKEKERGVHVSVTAEVNASSRKHFSPDF